MTTAINAERFALAAFRNATQTAEDLETVEINEQTNAGNIKVASFQVPIELCVALTSQPTVKLQCKEFAQIVDT